MAGLGKYLTVCLVVLLVVATTAQFTVNAQTIPKPSVPEFSVRLVNNSYSTHPITTTTTDPYTGKQTTVTTPSQYLKDEYIEVSVKNQPFTPYSIDYHNIDSRPVNLYFDVIAQGHFTTDKSIVDESQSQIEDYNSQYTNFTLYRNEVPSPAVLDFKVRAIIGYLVNQYDPEENLPPPEIHDPNFVVTGTTSSWSNPQTLTITSSNPSPSVPEFPITMTLIWVIIGILVISVISLLLFTKHLKSIKPTSNIIKN